MTLRKSDFKLRAPDLRNLSDENLQKASEVERNNIWIVLDRVYDAYNVGEAARLIDTINGRGIILVGDECTADQNHRQVKKSSVYTSEIVEWRRVSTLEEVDRIFDYTGLSIVVEKINDEKIRRDLHLQLSGRIGTLSLKEKVAHYLSQNRPILITVGNESTGIIDEEWLYGSNAIIEIPMYGINNSMNVMMALGIALYKIVGFL